MADKQKIFISGPMFSPADLWEGNEIKAALVKAGFDTYWAPEDGIEDERLIKNLQSPLMAAPYYQKVAILVQKLGWTLDIYMATFGCDGMVMDMNGRVPDGGSIVEAANAYSCGMPLVLYKETSITMWGPFNNPMIAALTKDWEPVDSVDKIAPALTATIEAKDPAYQYVPPPAFARDLEIGKFVSEHRDEVMQILLTLSGLVDKIQLDLTDVWHWLLQQLGFDTASAPVTGIDLSVGAPGAS
jgi:nucleoside 2-deoxyribosyltransferase